MTITEAIRSALKTYGATQKNDLLRCVSQSLGFSRLGPRIRSAIETRLTLLTSSGGVVSREDDVFSLPD
jgi:hypothetical protein